MTRTLYIMRYKNGINCFSFRTGLVGTILDFNVRRVHCKNYILRLNGRNIFSENISVEQNMFAVYVLFFFFNENITIFKMFSL